MSNELPPKDRITRIMALIYEGGLTTTSGGNISIRESNGDIWITPAALDKGNLRAEQIVCVHPDGSVFGDYEPSSELPFHQAIYRVRPDIHAVIHAHSPALVSFSLVRKIPDTGIIPQGHSVCGKVGYAAYHLPGTKELAESISGGFSDGYHCLIMENHGAVAGGTDSDQAFRRFETLEFCANIHIKAHQIGPVKSLSNKQIAMFENATDNLEELSAAEQNPEEDKLREEICSYVRRACRQKLMISTYGTISVRLKGDDFLITPADLNRYNLRPEDLVLIRGGKKEPGNYPDRSTQVHRRIYASHPAINCIITTQPPNATAFCVSGKTIDTHTIPESYFTLSDIKIIPYGDQFGDSPVISGILSKETPVLLIQNDGILTTGGTILQAFDRLEVAEFSARSLIDANAIGQMIPISSDEIRQIREKYMS